MLRAADGTRTALDVEIDGAYYGALLRGKVRRLAERGRPLVWVCEAGRAARLRAAGVGRVLVVPEAAPWPG